MMLYVVKVGYTCAYIGYGWLCMVMHGYTWVGWSYMTDYTWLYVVIHCYMWLY